MHRPLISLIAALRPAISVLIVAACQSYQPATLPGETHLPSDPTAEVRVTEKNGKQTRLVETSIEHDSIVGRGFVFRERQAIAMADVANLEIGDPDGSSTAGVTVGILAIPLVLVVLLLVVFSGGHHGT